MTMEVKELPVEALKEFYSAANEKAAAELISSLHATDAARVLESLGDDEAAWAFALLDTEKASDVLLELEGEIRERLLASMPKEELVDVVEEMETDDAADVISDLPVEDAKRVLEGIGAEDSVEVKKLLTYPEDTAGGKMQAELVSVGRTATVKDAIEEVRRKSKEIENISSVFVVDEEKRLLGSVPINKLILNDEDALMSAIMDVETMKVSTDVDQEEVARMFKRYDLLSMAVVDSGGRLVGRITVDDVVDVIEEEIVEDFYRMASVNVGERAMDAPLRSFKLRAPWLLVNLATAFAAASVVKIFAGTIEKLVILAVFMPIVAGMGGNAATQAITVIVRGLALGEISPKNAKRVLVKEALVGLSNGLLIGTIAILVSYVIGVNPVVGVLLFLAMVGNLVLAGVSGTIIPLLLKKFGHDPALASSIFVTTCTDIGGFFIFLGLATVFMHAGIL